MSDSAEYTPPDVWTWEKGNGGAFASINRPIAGATHDKQLPVGTLPITNSSLALITHCGHGDLALVRGAGKGLALRRRRPCMKP